MATAIAQTERQESCPRPRETCPPSREATAVLVDGLVHDARNPLNALSLHLEVLSERIRRELDEVPEAHRKSLSTMAEQVSRVDLMLKQFAEFLAPRAGGEGRPDLSAITREALAVLAHECRRRQLALRPQLEDGVRVALREVPALRALVVSLLAGAVVRTPLGREVGVELRRVGGVAVLEVTCGQAGELSAAVAHFAAAVAATVQRTTRGLSVELPLAV